MNSATLNIRVQQRRMLGRSEAAAYCALPAKRFESECPCRPVELPGGRKAWDVHDLDRWLDGLKPGDAADLEAIVGKLG